MRRTRMHVGLYIYYQMMESISEELLGKSLGNHIKVPVPSFNYASFVMKHGKTRGCMEKEMEFLIVNVILFRNTKTIYIYLLHISLLLFFHNLGLMLTMNKFIT